jgi:Putative transposase of IS4/5 family (DUF4096)
MGRGLDSSGSNAQPESWAAHTPAQRDAASGAQQVSVAGMITYPSDLTDEQWDEIEPWVPDLPNHYEVPYRERDVVDTIRYQYHQNCQWNELPDVFPPPDDVQRHLHEWTEGSNRSVFEFQEPGSFLSKVRVDQASAERSAQESEAEHTTPRSNVTSDTIARRTMLCDQKTKERTPQLEDERGPDDDQSPSR